MNKVTQFFKKMDKNQKLAAVAVVVIVIAGGLLIAKNNPNLNLNLSFMGGSDKATAQKVVDYINNNKLAASTATLVDGTVTNESGLVKFSVAIGTSTFPTYATKDGKLFFPQVFSMVASAATPSTDTTASGATPATIKPADVVKTDTPSLEAYIVSSCPFGLQIQRAIANAIQAAPDLAKYVTMRYIGSVSGNTLSSMHGPEEGAENLRQICIRDEQPAKYWAYVSCYMQKSVATASSGMPLGDSPSCQASTGVDKTKLNACVTDPSRGLADAQKDFDLDTKYNISASPTLVLDGSLISEFDFGGRTSDAVKTIVCDASKNAPSFCSKTLDTTSASTSFSLTYADAGGAASTASTQCATQ